VPISTFGDEDTEILFRTGTAPGIPADIRPKALQRMDRLDAARRLGDLAQPAGMRLRKAPKFGPGFYRVFVRRTWWLAFCWEHPDCTHVQLVETTRALKRKR
jgi:plasmid maintenance system killer protein